MSTEIAQISNKPSLVSRFAQRFGVDPNKMMSTLKSTAFRQSDGKDISNEQMMALMVVADQYKLNPFTKEIYAFPDKGGIVPIVGIDGWSRIINEHPQFDGMDFEDKDGSACTCTIHRKDRNHPIKVTEYLSECSRATAPWKSHPRRMLRHKAMMQCARIAFGYTGIYDQDEGERIIQGEVEVYGKAESLDDLDKKAPPARFRKDPPPVEEAEEIDTDTGEVITAEHSTTDPNTLIKTIESADSIETLDEVLKLAESLPQDSAAFRKIADLIEIRRAELKDAEE